MTAHGWAPLSHDVTGEANAHRIHAQNNPPLQLCLDAVQTALVASERETAVAEDVAAEAQARLASKSYWA
jgi:hypothetical protein